MRQRGFTLIETIVCIAIIIILAVLLFPIYQRPHRDEGRGACQTRLRPLALAMAAYAQDYDNRFPLAINSRHGLHKPLSWAGVIEPYGLPIKEGSFQCPRDEVATDKQKSSYGYNAWLAESKGNDVKHPALVIMLFEVQADANNWTQTGTGPQAVTANARHKQGANYAFADGHVKWIKPASVTSAKPNGKNFTFAIR